MFRLAPAAVCLLLLGLPQTQATQSDAPPTQAQQQPVFRAGANFVAVDVYPSRDGRFIEGLTANDFQVFEDGVPQVIETFELLQAGRFATMEERRDPASPQEARRQAADPRTQVFVLYLDGQHIDHIDPIEGPRKATAPVLSFLRDTGARDLFGVMTSNMGTDDLVLGRRLQAVEDAVAGYWDRVLEVQRDDRTTGGVHWPRSEYEAMLAECPVRGVNRNDLLDLARLEHVLESLRGLSQRLGAMREFRSHVFLFTGGWELDAIDPSRLIPSFAPPPPQISSRGGRLRAGAPEPGYGADPAVCNAEIFRLSSLDTWRLYQDVLEAAEQNNVSIHTIDPQGLAAFDDLGRDASSGSARAPGRAEPTGFQRAVTRLGELRTLAYETGGRAIVATEDVTEQLHDLSDDLASYYLLGYYSTNGAFDGKYRRIDVKTTQEAMDIVARQGYLAPTPEEIAAMDAARDAGDAAADDDSGFADALEAIGRVDDPADVFTAAVVRRDALVVTVEASESAHGRTIRDGTAVELQVTDASGGTRETVEAVFEGYNRSLQLPVPLAAIGDGPWHAAVLVDDSIADRIDIERPPTAPINAGRVFRARTARTSPLWPAVQMQFRRTERVHIEWDATGPLDRREGRLLGPDGAALPIAVTLSERDDDGQAVLAADVSLNALGPGDYVIEVTAAAEGMTVQEFIGIRVGG